LASDAPLARFMALAMRFFLSGRPLEPTRSMRQEANMELSSFFGSDAALLVFSGLGLLATGLAILRDIPTQQRVVEQPVQIRR